MRPIVLDMNGFASFREAARIDFTDAEFFALVGPTGSGKSTVIDAMTFALYGSVPRWGRKGMVSLALAPTTARGTVRLVFEVDAQRYVVARELRRMGSQVNQKAASLERLADPLGRGEPGEPPTEVLAKDLAGVGEAVERLLGLSYEDFCQCVVLPQGQFADFLHAKPTERQEILLRLLGAEHYRQMMMRANQRASDAAKRAETLTETLAAFGDATADAQDAAAAAETALERLAEQVDAVRPRLHAADQELATAEAELARLEQDRAALAAVRVPDDASALDADLAATRAALDHSEQAEGEALDTDREARAALNGGPERAPLELIRQHRAERDQRAAALPSARDDLARLSGQSAQAETAVHAAAAALETMRARRDAAASAATAADQQVQDLSVEHAALTSVAVPDGVDELDARHDAAIAAGEQALTTLQTAEQADTDARAARACGPPPGPLEQARRDLGDLAELAAAQTPARASLEQARAGKAAAQAALQAAEAGREKRQRDVDEARRAHAAAGLRPHLVPGEACPVCEQLVTALPAPLAAPAIDGAQARLDEAAAIVAAARSAVSDATAAEVRAAADQDSLAGQRQRMVASLAAAQKGPLSGADLPALADVLADETGLTAGEPARVAAALAGVDATLQACRELDEAANAAAAAVHSARDRAGAARAALDQVQAETVTARAVLRDARDPLVGLGAPAADDVSLAAAWAELVAWAGGLAQAREKELAEARQATQAAASGRDKAQAQFGQAEADLTELREDAKRAGQAEQKAEAHLAGLTERIAELDERLRDAPDAAQVTAQLELRDELEAAASAAEQRLLGARTARSQTQQQLAGLEHAEAAARSRLSAARDPLVRLGAPALDGPACSTAGPNCRPGPPAKPPRETWTSGPPGSASRPPGPVCTS